ncbi:hypothetical protein [Glaciecola sp. SC05]|uniref:hypothetical protein n=1 Tax=Glaciecola sp. SC05 TaxID=1987355 RepID=UPI003528DDF7
MDKDDIEIMLEQIARNHVATINLSYILGKLVPVEDRKVFGPMLKELLKSNYDLQHQIGWKFPELHPDYLGLENFAALRKKYEIPELPVKMPTQDDIATAKEQWQKIQNRIKR